MRIGGYVMAMAIGVLAADPALAQFERRPLAPSFDRRPSYHLSSVEALTAQAKFVVRGVIAKVGNESASSDSDAVWIHVTLDVRETLKGDTVRILRFAVETNRTAHKSSRAALEEWQGSQKEVVWILQAAEKSEHPARIAVQAAWIWGIAGGRGWMPVIPLGQHDAADAERMPRLLTMQLQVPGTSDELLKALKDAIAFEQKGASATCHDLRIPKEIALRTGHGGHPNCLLVVPADSRLEELARRLVQAPGEFLGKGDHDGLKYQLRLEGTKTLRQIPSEKNLTFMKAWLADPASLEDIKGDMKVDLLPPVPRPHKTTSLPVKLIDVPEVHFQQPLTKALSTADAQLHTAITIDRIHLFNRQKTDAFIETLMSQRADLAGLSFAMGDACRLSQEAGQQFVAARKAVQSAQQVRDKKAADYPDRDLMEYYQETDHYYTEETDTAARLRIEGEFISMRIASLMQMLAPESAQTRLGLVRYLDGVAHPDAARALARLAIFSEEAEIRTAAVRALKLRRDSDYTDVLLTGLKYPWPAVAQRSTEAIVQLGRSDLVPHLKEVLQGPDPRAPQVREVGGKKVAVVREVVRVNHHHNCLLCHAPATSSRDKASEEETSKVVAKVEKKTAASIQELVNLMNLTAQVPVPSEAMNAYYSPTMPDILVRFDVTYLRQDFSLKLPVADAKPWPDLQRYDFLVRTREVSEQESLVITGLLAGDSGEGETSPYHRAAAAALSELSR